MFITSLCYLTSNQNNYFKYVMLKYHKLLLHTLNLKQYSCLCRYTTAINNQYDCEVVKKSSSNTTKPTNYMPTSRQKLRNYLSGESHLLEMLRYIPEKYLKLKRKGTIEHMYLVDSQIAKEVVSQILPIIERNKEQIVCETNAGLGLISAELLDNGWPMVRLYEVCLDFRTALKVK